MMNKASLAYAAVLGAVFLWGISFVATKVALQTVPPYTMLFARFAVAGLLLAVFFLAKRPEKLKTGDLWLFMLLGLMEPALYFIFETHGLLHTSASVASLIIAGIPVFVTLLAALFLKEPLRPAAFLGIALTLVGVGLLVHQDLILSSSSASLKGNLFILGAALCASVYTVVSRRLGADYHPLTVTTLQAVFAALFFLPFAWREWDGIWISGVSEMSVVAVVYLALMATLVAFLFYNHALSVLPASNVAVFINVIPMVTVLAAWGILRESLSLGQLWGGALILLGVRITSRVSNREEIPASPQDSLVGPEDQGAGVRTGDLPFPRRRRT